MRYGGPQLVTTNLEKIVIAIGALGGLTLGLSACSSASTGGNDGTPCGAQSCPAGEYCLNQACAVGCLTDSNCASTQRCEKTAGHDVGSCQRASDGGTDGAVDASLAPDSSGAKDASADAPATFPCGSNQCVYAQEACVEFPNSTSCVAIPISDQCNLSVCANASTHFAYLCSTSNYPNAVCVSGGDTCRLTIECVL